MAYDLRCGDRVIEKLGLSELRQELTNLLEGGAELVELAPHGCLPAVRRVVRSRKKKAAVS